MRRPSKTFASANFWSDSPGPRARKRPGVKLPGVDPTEWPRIDYLRCTGCGLLASNYRPPPAGARRVQRSSGRAAVIVSARPLERFRCVECGRSWVLVPAGAGGDRWSRCWLNRWLNRCGGRLRPTTLAEEAIYAIGGWEALESAPP